MKKNAICYINVCNNIRQSNFFQLKQLFYSINSLQKKTNLDNIDIFIISNPLIYNYIKNLNITLIDYNKYINYINIKNRAYSYFFYKWIIFIADELSKYNKILYLDNDIEINSDISDIFNIDINHCDILGVNQTHVWKTDISLLENLQVHKICKFLNLTIRSNIDQSYINAGVYLINNNIRLKYNLIQYLNNILQFNDLLKNNNEYDQRLLNYFFNIDSSLDISYNIFYNALISKSNFLNKIYNKYRNNNELIKIIHYTTGTGIKTSKEVFIQKINLFFKKNNIQFY